MEFVRQLAEDSDGMRETHISWVLFRGDEVFKLKKPVDFGFLDFTTRQRRLAACRAEVALNRRLAPDVYLGVVPVTRDGAGHHRIGGKGEVVDQAVHMRRLDDADSAAAKLAAGTLGAADVRRIAARIAAFHADAATDDRIARFGDPDHVLVNVEENFSQTDADIHGCLSEAAIAELQAAQVGFVAGHRDVLRRRMRAGRIRDGHGDLRLDHVYLPAGGDVVIIDCIEFNDRFRYADTCADTAFLAMDLMRAGAPVLAEVLLGAYAQAAQDYDLYDVVDFYIGYRAFVRGKVALFTAADGDAPAHVRERARAEARRALLLAEAAARPRTQRPAVIAVGGGIACGKTTLANALSDRIGAVVVDTDRTRKHLAGTTAEQSLAAAPFADAYAAETTAEVYSEVLRRALTVLSSGRSVIVEASFAQRGWRRAVRDLADDHHADFVFAQCRAPEDEVRRRLERRGRGPSVSDGSLGVVDSFRASMQPVTELGAACVTVDTTGAVEASVERVLARLRSGGPPTGPRRASDPDTSATGAPAHRSS